MRGFTLLELLFTVLIVSIFSMLTYHGYTAYITQVRRIDGKNSLLHMAALLERYYSKNNTYIGATLPILGLTNPTSQGGFYNLAINSVTATTYTLGAIPQDSQASDTSCASLTFNHLGQRGISGTGKAENCW